MFFFSSCSMLLLLQSLWRCVPFTKNDNEKSQRPNPQFFLFFSPSWNCTRKKTPRCVSDCFLPFRDTTFFLSPESLGKQHKDRAPCRLTRRQSSASTAESPRALLRVFFRVRFVAPLSPHLFLSESLRLLTQRTPLDWTTAKARDVRLGRLRTDAPEAAPADGRERAAIADHRGRRLCSRAQARRPCSRSSTRSGTCGSTRSGTRAEACRPADLTTLEHPRPPPTSTCFLFFFSLPFLFPFPTSKKAKE